MISRGKFLHLLLVVFGSFVVMPGIALASPNDPSGGACDGLEPSSGLFSKCIQAHSARNRVELLQSRNASHNPHRRIITCIEDLPLIAQILGHVQQRKSQTKNWKRKSQDSHIWSCGWVWTRLYLGWFLWRELKRCVSSFSSIFFGFLFEKLLKHGQLFPQCLLFNTVLLRWN